MDSESLEASNFRKKSVRPTKARAMTGHQLGREGAVTILRIVVRGSVQIVIHGERNAVLATTSTARGL